jgi:hypothetical protein
MRRRRRQLSGHHREADSNTLETIHPRATHNCLCVRCGAPSWVPSPGAGSFSPLWLIQAKSAGSKRGRGRRCANRHCDKQSLVIEAGWATALSGVKRIRPRRPPAFAWGADGSQDHRVLSALLQHLRQRVRRLQRRLRGCPSHADDRAAPQGWPHLIAASHEQVAQGDSVGHGADPGQLRRRPSPAFADRGKGELIAQRRVEAGVALAYHPVDGVESGTLPSWTQPSSVPEGPQNSRRVGQLTQALVALPEGRPQAASLLAMRSPPRLRHPARGL